MNGIAIDLEATIEKIHNPVVAQSGSRVQAPLALPIVSQAGICDFDDQHGRGGMGFSIIPRGSRDHGDVRLGLRIWIKSQWQLDPHMEAATTCDAQGITDEGYGGCVAAFLRSHFEDFSVDQLDSFAG